MSAYRPVEMPSAAATKPRIRARRIVFLLLVAVLLGGLLVIANAVRGQIRTTPIYDPPVLAGQVVACTAGFYAHRGSTVVLTISGHCIDRVNPPRDAAGRLIGTFGAAARRTDCPTGRVCAGSDIVELILTNDHIPWGHLNLVDLGTGGYRTIAPDARPLSCVDLRVGTAVEMDGLGLYRSGRIVGVGPYDFGTDTVFPCMALTDLDAAIGDSGAAIIADGRPAGIAAREFSGKLGFTSLAEGLEDLGLTLCTDPDCGITRPAGGSSAP